MITQQVGHTQLIHKVEVKYLLPAVIINATDSFFLLSLASVNNAVKQVLIKDYTEYLCYD